MTALAELVSVALATAGSGGSAASSTDSLIAALHGARFLAGRVLGA